MEQRPVFEHLVDMYKQQYNDSGRLFYEEQAYLYLTKEEYLDFCKETGATPPESLD